jgi:CRISPR-associated protein Csy3
MLSFARSVQPSEGLFWGTRSSDGGREPIEVVERGVRGQSSEATAGKDGKSKPGNSNPQVVEAAFVPLGCDGVELSFSLWVTNHSAEPWACDVPAVGQAYRALVAAYAQKGGFSVLARGYVWNIANARFAWRNRYLADHMRVHVTFGDRTAPLIFDPLKLDLAIEPGAPLPTAETLRGAVSSNDPEQVARVEELLAHVEAGLRDGPRSLKVSWQAATPEAQEVFPSQEYLREEKRDNAPSRVYAKLPTSERRDRRAILQASMHSQKIGAALRHLDVWHGSLGHGAVPINPYAGVQETGEVLRDKDTGRSLYDLRTRADALFEGIEAATSAEHIPNEVHFVVANLVRGGVFGEKPA